MVGMDGVSFFQSLFSTDYNSGAISAGGHAVVNDAALRMNLMLTSADFSGPAGGPRTRGRPRAPRLETRRLVLQQNLGDVDVVLGAIKPHVRCVEIRWRIWQQEHARESLETEPSPPRDDKKSGRGRRRSASGGSVRRRRGRIGNPAAPPPPSSTTARASAERAGDRRRRDTPSLKSRSRARVGRRRARQPQSRHGSGSSLGEERARRGRLARAAADAARLMRRRSRPVGEKSDDRHGPRTGTRDERDHSSSREERARTRANITVHHERLVGDAPSSRACPSPVGSASFPSICRRCQARRLASMARIDKFLTSTSRARLEQARRRARRFSLAASYSCVAANDTARLQSALTHSGSSSVTLPRSSGGSPRATTSCKPDSEVQQGGDFHPDDAVVFLRARTPRRPSRSW